MRADSPHGVRRRGGFTIIELVVAIVVSGLVVLSARELLEGLATTQLALERTRRDADGIEVSERLLRSVVANMDLDADDRASFAGGKDSAQFSSWCPSTRGWLDACHVRLRIDNGLVLEFPGLREHLPAERQAVGLLFLSDFARGGAWTTIWPASRSAPVAIGVVRVGNFGRDTLILRIGDRG